MPTLTPNTFNAARRLLRDLKTEFFKFESVKDGSDTLPDALGTHNHSYTLAQRQAQWDALDAALTAIKNGVNNTTLEARPS